MHKVILKVNFFAKSMTLVRYDSSRFEKEIDRKVERCQLDACGDLCHQDDVENTVIHKQ